MIREITKLDTRELQELAAAIRAGRVRSPYTSLALQRVLAPRVCDAAATALNSLALIGISAEGTAAVLELLIADREGHLAADDVIDLVTSGPDTASSANRDTAVVVRDLFAYAKKSVWIAGYAVHKGRHVFEALADRMAVLPNLHVVLMLDVRRSAGDATRNEELLRRFKTQFQERDWPHGRRLPEVFYFPRSLEADARTRAALHAKCIVIDKETCFVSSANFTEAAQTKNIEVGLLVRSHVVAMRLQRYLETLVESEIAVPIW